MHSFQTGYEKAEKHLALNYYANELKHKSRRETRACLLPHSECRGRDCCPLSHSKSETEFLTQTDGRVERAGVHRRKSEYPHPMGPGSFYPIFLGEKKSWG